MTEQTNPEITGQRLLNLVERIERLNSEKQAISEDIKDVYLEAKSQGFEAKIIRRIVKDRKISLEKRREEEELLELYKSAINME